MTVVLKWMWCVLLMASTSLAATLKCFHGSMESFTRIPISGLPLLLASPCLDQSRPTVIYTFGYRGKSDGPATTAVLTAYLHTKKRNVILLDWEEEAATGLMGTQLSYALNAVPNAVRLGNELGDALVAAAVAGIDLGGVHLLGHSLGAHLMGHAGRRTRTQGFVIPRITGFDPARALYEAPVKLRDGLDRTCAIFVDIIHTDPGRYGLKKAYGTIDIWPNYETDHTTLQPGCVPGNFEQFSRADLCNHDRSWQLYVEAIYDPTSLPMVSAANFEDWVLQSLQVPGTRHTTLLGELTNTKARGNYYLSSNAFKPYSRGKLGLNPSITQAVRRRRTSSMAVKRIRISHH